MQAATRTRKLCLRRYNFYASWPNADPWWGSLVDNIPLWLHSMGIYYIIYQAIIPCILHGPHTKSRAAGGRAWALSWAFCGYGILYHGRWYKKNNSANGYRYWLPDVGGSYAPGYKVEIIFWLTQLGKWCPPTAFYEYLLPIQDNNNLGKYGRREFSQGRPWISVSSVICFCIDNRYIYSTRNEARTQPETQRPRLGLMTGIRAGHVWSPSIMWWRCPNQLHRGYLCLSII